MLNEKAKITLIGAGQIGGTMALLAASRGMGDILMVDANADMAKGKALDISQAMSIGGYDVSIAGTGDYAAISGSDVIIVTAGIPRKPGMSRDDVLNVNVEVVSGVAKNIAKYAPEAFVIIVTNPLDSMVYVAQAASGLPTNKVIGMAGVLDSARLRFFLAEEFKVSAKDIDVFVLGGHGDTMVPMVRYSTISGVPIADMISMGYSNWGKIDEIVQRTKDGGAEVLKLLGNGSAFYAPAVSALEMAESYLLDRKRILPCAAYLDGEYGVSGCYVGVPVVIGKNGAEAVIELQLNESEKTLFDQSVAAVASTNSKIKI